MGLLVHILNTYHREAKKRRVVHMDPGRYEFGDPKNRSEKDSRPNFEPYTRLQTEDIRKTGCDMRHLAEKLAWGATYYMPLGLKCVLEGFALWVINSIINVFRGSQRLQ